MVFKKKKSNIDLIIILPLICKENLQLLVCNVIIILNIIHNFLLKNRREKRLIHIIVCGCAFLCMSRHSVKCTLTMTLAG